MKNLFFTKKYKMKITNDNKIKILGVEVSHPERCVDNNFFIEQFDKEDKDIRNLLKAYGRDKRYLGIKGIDSTLTLGINAAKKVLNSTGIKGEDIDLIVYASQFPEVTVPTQALILHNAIKGKPQCMIKDMNVNCLGMLVAFDEACRFLSTTETFSKALIVGADCMSYSCRKDDELTYPLFGDMGCAVIIEKEENYDSLFLGSSYTTNSDEADIVKFPRYGYYSNRDKNILWTPFDAGFIPNISNELFERTLKKVNLQMSDINHFCLSQFAIGLVNGVMEANKLSKEKAIYIGDKYGYTGVSSPFVAFYEAIKEGKIKRGDYVLFWSIATFWTSSSVIIKY